MAVCDLLPSEEITCLAGDDPEQGSLFFQNSAKKLKFLACVSMQEFEKLIIKYCAYINLSSD